MSEDAMKLPGMKNVSVVSRLIPRLMEIADPVPELYHKLDLGQLLQVTAVGLKFQQKMIALDMERLKVEKETLGEMEKLMEGFRR